MPTYNLEARYLIQHDLQALDPPLVQVLWSLFEHIAKRWDPDCDTAPMKSNFLVFISNRIEADYHYLSDYRNAADMIQELAAEQCCVSKGMDKLLTDVTGNVQPPLTRLARARQFVSNEFVQLFLSLGGFKKYGSPLNYQGYIGGGNIPGSSPTPYRTYSPTS